MKPYIIVVIMIVFTFFGCAPEEKEGHKTDGRWMDRTIYFAYPNDPVNNNRNTYFQKTAVQEAIRKLEESTALGEGYFRFKEVDESELYISLEAGELDDQKSFILIWPDEVFNNFVINEINGEIPDPNAVTVINHANKRMFFMIFRASCASSSSAVSTQCDSIGVNGFSAMVFRQFGLLTGMGTRDCAASPSSIMCADSPSDLQFTSHSIVQFSAAFNNLLEQILQTPGYYR